MSGHKQVGKKRSERVHAALLASEALSRANNAIHAGSPPASAKQAHVQAADAGAGPAWTQIINADNAVELAQLQ